MGNINDFELEKFKNIRIDDYYNSNPITEIIFSLGKTLDDCL